MKINSFWIKKTIYLIFNIKKSLGYFIVSCSTFAFDITLLTLLKNFTSIKIFILAGFTYFLAISIDYLLLRIFVYKNSIRSNYKGYFYFLIIALSGSGMVSVVMYYFVEVLGYYYLFVRPVLAIVLGVWNYTLNTSLNFRR